MTIKFNHLDEISYNTLRQQMIEAAEGRGNVVYRDSVGIATIGIGLNLRVGSVAREVLSIALNRGGHQIEVSESDITTLLAASSHTFKTNETARQAINTAWRIIANNHSVTSTELSLTDDEMNNVFRTAAEEREDTLTQHFSRNNQNSTGETVQAAFADSDYSYERLALFSLVYNGGEALLGNNLTTAINDGDRFRAWFEIREASNGGDSRNHGIAKRRFYEAELFGLFNDHDNPTIEEIRHIINTLNERIPTADNRGTATYLDKISKYENDFYVKKDEHGQETGPRHYFESMIESIPVDYSGSPRANTKPYIGEVFRPLGKELLKQFLPSDLPFIDRITMSTHYISGQVILGITIDNDSTIIAPRAYSSCKNGQWNNGSKVNLLVALEYERDDAGNLREQDGKPVRKGMILKGNNDCDIMIGGDGANVMEGNGGNDIIIGGKSGDTIVGGAGQDKMYGGKGADTYEFNSINDIDGDIIYDPDGGGKIRFGKIVLGDSKGNIHYKSGASWTEKQGGFTFTYELIGNSQPAKDENGKNIANKFISDLQITVTDKEGVSKSFTIKDWQFEQRTIGYYGADPDNSTQTVLQGSNFAFTLKLPAPGKAENLFNGDQRAPYMNDGKTFDWGKTSWNTITGILQGGVKEDGFSDVIRGTAQRDIINGHGGNDALDGGDGNDTITGGDGHDLITGGKGSDWLFGGKGNDFIYGSCGLLPEVQRHGSGDNAADLKRTGTGNETVVIDGASWGVYQEETGRYAILGPDNSAAATAADPGNTRGDIIVGGEGQDKIFGSQESDAIFGGDLPFAGEADKTKPEDGNSDNDTIYGLGGNDYISGGKGNDTIHGDTNIHNAGLSGYMPADIAHGNDIIDGGGGDDNLYGNGGNDIISGGDGNDLINGDDVINVVNDGPTSGDDTLDGGNGNDRIFGGAGNDNIDGGNDNDLIFPGAGNDTMTGGAGDDTFVIRKADLDHKTITDFGDSDRLVLLDSGLDDYELLRTGNDLVLRLKSGEGDITVQHFFALPDDSAATIHEHGETIRTVRELREQFAATAAPAGETPVTAPAAGNLPLPGDPEPLLNLDNLTTTNRPDNGQHNNAGKQGHTLPCLFAGDILDGLPGGDGTTDLAGRMREDRALMDGLWGDGTTPGHHAGNYADSHHLHGSNYHSRLEELHEELRGLV